MRVMTPCIYLQGLCYLLLSVASILTLKCSVRLIKSIHHEGVKTFPKLDDGGLINIYRCFSSMIAFFYQSEKTWMVQY